MKIALRAWAAQNFDPPPKQKTLQRWARDCWIFPLPEKIGRTYYVEPTAKFIGADHNKISRGTKAA